MISETPITVEQLINYIEFDAVLDSMKERKDIHDYTITFLPDDDDTYVDVYIHPVRSVEFICIPINIINT